MRVPCGEYMPEWKRDAEQLLFFALLLDQHSAGKELAGLGVWRFLHGETDFLRLRRSDPCRRTWSTANRRSAAARPRRLLLRSRGSLLCGLLRLLGLRLLGGRRRTRRRLRRRDRLRGRRRLLLARASDVPSASAATAVMQVAARRAGRAGANTKPAVMRSMSSLIQCHCAQRTAVRRRERPHRALSRCQMRRHRDNRAALGPRDLAQFMRCVPAVVRRDLRPRPRVIDFERDHDESEPDHPHGPNTSRSRVRGLPLRLWPSLGVPACGAENMRSRCMASRRCAPGFGGVPRRQYGRNRKAAS